MSDYPNETVQDAANKLIAALALHEDARGTVTDALHDMYDAGREHAAPQAANLQRAIPEPGPMGTLLAFPGGA